MDVVVLKLVPELEVEVDGTDVTEDEKSLLMKTTIRLAPPHDNDGYPEAVRIEHVKLHSGTDHYTPYRNQKGKPPLKCLLTHCRNNIWENISVVLMMI